MIPRIPAKTGGAGSGNFNAENMMPTSIPAINAKASCVIVWFGLPRRLNTFRLMDSLYLHKGDYRWVA